MATVMLPVELFLKILNFLDIGTLVHCRQLCHQFRVLIDGTASLQYKIELAVSNMEDGPPGPVSLADRLDMLKKRDEAWNTLAWQQDCVIEMSRGEVWELYGGVFAQHRTDDNAILFWQLPSTLRGIDRRDWAVPLSDLVVRDFTMDPAQDLLILVVQLPNSARYQIHIRMLSTGEPHPSAPTPAVFPHSVKSRSRGVHHNIQVFADYLGILFVQESHSDFVVWNWKTGRIELRLAGKKMKSFVFLTDKHVMLGVVTNATVNLRVMDFRNITESAIGIDRAGFLCSFSYPLIAQGIHPVNMTIRSDPEPLWTPDPLLQVPFFNGSNRLYVITLWVTTNWQHTTPLAICVLSSTLLKHIEGVDAGQERRVIPWEEWGPNGTRMIPRLKIPSVWVCYVFGTKIIELEAQNEEEALVVVTLYDFNQLAYQRALQQGCSPNEEIEFFSAGNRTGCSGLFRTDFYTCLPYRKRTFSLNTPMAKSNIEAVMCGEDSVILVADSDSDTGRQFRILTF